MGHNHIQRADLKDFTAKMEGQMRLNHHKEVDKDTKLLDPFLYAKDNPLDLIAQAQKHLDRLKASVIGRSEPDEVFRNAADGANFLMMASNGYYLRAVDPDLVSKP